MHMKQAGLLGWSFLVLSAAAVCRAQEPFPPPTGTAPAAVEPAVRMPDAAVTNTPAVAPVSTNAQPVPEVHTNAAPVHVPPVAHPAPAPATPDTGSATTNVPPQAVVTNVPHQTPVVHVVEVPLPEEKFTPPDEGWFSETGPWRVGTRYTQYTLQDSKRGKPRDGSFFGTITEITEDQDDEPNKVFIQYRLFRSPVWIGASYDHVIAVTMDDSDGDGVPDTGGGDGYEELTGYILYLQAAWDNKTRLVPYAQVGKGYYEAEFVPNAWGAGGQRWVESDSHVSGVELGGGLNIQLYKGLSADLFAKYMKIDDIEGEWYYGGNNEQDGKRGGAYIMTMSYVAYGLGLNYRF